MISRSVGSAGGDDTAFAAIGSQLPHFDPLPVSLRLLLAALGGLVGTALVFWPEVAKISLTDDALRGILWTLASIAAAALGNMAAIRNTARQIPILLINAHAMLWGAAASLTVALLLARPIGFSPTVSYTGSLLYLAIAGSCIAFGCFMMLLKRIEDYRWSLSASLGVALILAGNWLALRRVPVPITQDQVIHQESKD